MPFSVPAETSSDATLPLLPTADRFCEVIRRLAIAAGLILGGSNILIWLGGAVPAFLRAHEMMVMRMNTGVCITALALSLSCWGRSPTRSARRWAQAFALVAALIGGLTALQEVAGVDFGIDQLFAPATIPGDLANGMVRHPGRMSLNAALSITFLGCALLWLDSSIAAGTRRVWPAPSLAMIGALPVLLGLVGYLLGINAFTELLRSTHILLHTAVALGLLAIGILAARPDRPPVRRILSTGADGILLRWTLPGSATLLLSLGWAIGKRRQAGFVAPGEDAAMMLYGGLVLLFAMLVVVSRGVGRQEMRARQAMEALRQGQERSRAIVDTALDAVVLLDEAGKIVDWNPAAERIFGWSREEMVGKTLADCIVPEDLRSTHYRWLSELKGPKRNEAFGQRQEVEALRRDGARFPIELSVNSLPGATRALFVVFLRDITESRATEERLRSAKDAAESASRAKDHFVAALSHELRTPLTPVLLGAAALRADERLPEDVRSQMVMMERNIALEARLIDDLLDLTRITRGKFPLRTEACDAHSLLCHALEIVRDEADAKGIALDVDLAAERFGVTGDPARLQQVFWNLLKNAVKFSPSGGRIALNTRDDSASARLVIEVSDTGMGFNPEAAEEIFQPFEQAGREGDHRLGGLGLGLAIARAIVDLHGGVIRAHSRGAGLGATFTVEFPHATAAPLGMLTAETRAPSRDSAAVPRRILLVEDHEPTLTILSRLLTRAGHTVTTAQSIATAQAAAKVAPFEILISDLGLPDGTGVELINALRAVQASFSAIAISGYGMEEDLLRTREAGFAAHLVKPVDFDQVRIALHTLLPAS